MKELSAQEVTRLQSLGDDMRSAKRYSVEWKEARMKLGKYLVELPQGGLTLAKSHVGLSGSALSRVIRYYRDMRKSGFGRHI